MKITMLQSQLCQPLSAPAERLEQPRSERQREGSTPALRSADDRSQSIHSPSSRASSCRCSPTSRDAMIRSDHARLFQCRR